MQRVFSLTVGLSLFIIGCTSQASPTAVDQVEDVPEPGALELAWSIAEIGSGIKPAFALDREDVAHVAFLTEADHGTVFYATNSSGDFELTTVAEGYFYGPVDIAVGPNGTPYIAYHDHQETAFKPELGDEVVADLSSGTWRLTTVIHDGHDGWDNSIVIDSAGNWHTAAVDPAQFGSEAGVEYATNRGGTVQVQAVGSGPANYEFGTSIQLNPSGAPAIAYYDSEEQQLEYATLTDTGWSVEVVDDEGDVGRYASLAFDSAGNPHISYFLRESNSSGTVRYAYWDGSKWNFENVDSLDDIRTGQVGARKITALALDEENIPHLAYTDRSRLIYAVKNDSGWRSQQVISADADPLGQLVEVALDSEGNPHLIWFVATSFSPLAGTVMYASGS